MWLAQYLLLISGIFISGTFGQQGVYDIKFYTVKVPTNTGERIDGDLYERLHLTGIPENTAAGAYVGTLKAYVEGVPNAKIVYEVRSEYLVVEASTGICNTSDTDYDYELFRKDPNSHIVTMEAKYLTPTGFTETATASFKLKIIDVNDNAPVFIRPKGLTYSAKVSENAAVGTFFSNEVQANDTDSSYYALLKFKCHVPPVGDNITNIEVSIATEACLYFGVETEKVPGVNLFIAKLYTLRKLDFESISSFAMSIMAYDNYDDDKGVQMSSTANIQIIVIDEQDSNPVFSGANAKIFVAEHTPVGTNVGNVITVADGDEGARRQLKFEIKDPADAFGLNVTRGANNIYTLRLIVIKEIDRENFTHTSSYTFRIVATELNDDLTPTSDFTEQSIDVSILDINDNAPIFDKDIYTVEVTEPSKRGILSGLSLFLQDKDGASFNSYGVSITKQSFPGTFSLNAQAGSGKSTLYFEIDNIGNLDYDAGGGIYRNQIIQVEAVDNKDGALRSQAVVNVTVTDANDNSPIFNPTKYSSSVLETADVGTNITTISASDLDSGNNGRITYNLPAHADVFKLDPVTGQLSLNKKLDYETTSLYNLFPTASDNGENPNRADAEITITVINVNDDGPKFLQASYSSNMDELSQTLNPQLSVMAVDSDGDTVTYQIVSGNVRNGFSIDRVSGKISIIRNDLTINDAIDKSYFKLEVHAIDSGSPAQTASTFVDISIRDINDQKPVFNATLYEKTISEIEKPGEVVLQVFATDADTGSNAQIKYEIESGGRDDFIIGTDSGVVFIRSNANIDYDKAKVYDIVVNAVDNGSPPLTGETRVKITVTDANNKNPVFDKTVYNQNIREDAIAGSSVIQTLASDTDSSSNLQYSIVVSSMRATSKNTVIFTSEFDYRVVFNMNKDTGLITVVKSLDYTSDWVIEFEIQATDTNAENPKPQIAKAQVIISVANIADPRPVFEYPWTRNRPVYQYSIDEGPARANLTRLIAREPDKSIVKNYEKVPGSDVGDYFTVDRETGSISLKRNIDYEVMNDVIPVMLSLVVKSTSPNSGLSASATVSYQIIDINDNKPEFGKSAYKFSMFENTVYPTEIGTVFASDKDSSTNAVFDFFLSGPFSENFTLLPQAITGESQLTVAQGKSIDYETHKQFKFVLHARNPNDRSSDNQVDLEIKVKDRNDNAPQFSKASYLFYCLETLPINGFIDSVLATDRDDGTNSLITYSMNDDGPAKNLFSIDPINGRMKVKTNLEGASYKSPYIVYVTARDSGSPRLSNTTTVNVTVSSGHEDKGLPVFTNPTDTNTTISILENVPIGYDVIQAAARPKTPGASVRFFFQSNTEIDSVFTISSSGLIETIAKLDREKKGSYDMIISAMDTLNSSRVSARKITVRIEDVDDNVPSFTSCPNRKYEKPEVVTITEGIRIGSFVYEALGCDLDLTPHNSMKYRFFYGQGNCWSNIADYLTLNENSGQLRTKVIINREKTAFLYACVEVYPFATQGRRKRATPDNVLEIRINVLDVNDQGPVFDPVRHTEIIFDLPKKDLVAQVRATDSDSSFYNKVRYSIFDVMYKSKEGGSYRVHTPFNINPDTGEITISFKSYRAFLNGYFNITVKAEDFYDSKMFDLTWVQVYVGEELLQVRVVTDTDYTKDITAIVSSMLKELDNANGNTIFKETQIRYHKDVSGTYIADKTDVCLLVVRNDAILDSYEAQTLLDEERAILNKYGFREDGMCEPATSRLLDGDYILWWVVVALAIFMFIIICILIVVLSFLYSDYRNFMETRQQYLVPLQH